MAKRLKSPALQVTCMRADIQGLLLAGGEDGLREVRGEEGAKLSHGEATGGINRVS